MSEATIISLFSGCLGALLIHIGRRQLKSRVAWARFIRGWKPITRDDFPVFYWFTVTINFLLGGILLYIAVGVLLP